MFRRELLEHERKVVMRKLISMILIIVIIACNVKVVSAVSFNYKSVVVAYDKNELYSFKLIVKHTKKKVHWRVSNKKYISIKKGKVRIKKKGNYKIYAKVGKKKLKCKVQALSETKFYKLTLKSYRQIKKQFEGIQFSNKPLGEYEYTFFEDEYPTMLGVYDIKNRKDTIKRLNSIIKNKIAWNPIQKVTERNHLPFMTEVRSLKMQD